METQTVVTKIDNLPHGLEYQHQIDLLIKRHQNLNDPFIVIIMQIKDLKVLSDRLPRYILMNLIRDLHQSFRRVIPRDQYIASFKNGFGFIFTGLNPGRVDVLTRNLIQIAAKVIRDGKYNNLVSRWTDILHQFLTGKEKILFKITSGWSIYPRDGVESRQLIERALYLCKGRDSL